MANQELLKYIKQQVELGVSKDVVKTTLLGAGWPDADVSQAFDAAFPAVAVAAPVAAVTAPVSAAASLGGTFSFQAQEVKKPDVASGTVSQDFFQPKTVDVFKPVASGAAVAPKNQFGAVPGSVKVISGHPIKLIVLSSVLGLATIGFGLLYFQSSGQTSTLNSQISSLQGQLSSVNAKLTQTQQSAATAPDMNAVQASIDDVNAQLAIFVAPVGASATSALQVSVRGTLSTSSAGYVLTTSKGIVLSLKNAKDSKFAGYLTQYIGSQIQISGTHSMLGSKDITVTAVNSVDIKTIMAAASTATSTSAASTTSVAAPAAVPKATPASVANPNP